MEGLNQKIEMEVDCTGCIWKKSKKMKSITRLMGTTDEDRWRNNGINLPPVSILDAQKCLHTYVARDTNGLHLRLILDDNKYRLLF